MRPLALKITFEFELQFGTKLQITANSEYAYRISTRVVPYSAASNLKPKYVYIKVGVYSRNVFTVIHSNDPGCLKAIASRVKKRLNYSVGILIRYLQLTLETY